MLALSVEVDAPAERTWDAAVDWARQGEWMLGTRVTPTAGNGQGVGARLEAFSGIGPIGFLDPMEITRWQPPRACHVRHLGRVVRGSGWVLVRPLFAYAVQLSLRRFARSVESAVATA